MNKKSIDLDADEIAILLQSLMVLATHVKITDKDVLIRDLLQNIDDVRDKLLNSES